MTTTDRICAFLQSKLPQSFWAFHGDSIRAFIEREVAELALAPNLEMCAQSMRDYASGKYVDLETLIAQGQAITNEDFHKQSKVTPAAMQEVYGADTTGVISDVREPTLQVTEDVVESWIRHAEIPHCDICSRSLVDFAFENREPHWHYIVDAGCELTVCQDCWEIEQTKVAAS